jgi:hypothetical protein
MNCLNQRYSSRVELEYHKDILCFLTQFGGKIHPVLGIVPYCCVGMLLLIYPWLRIYIFPIYFTHGVRVYHHSKHFIRLGFEY